jgi:hypothetical protein
MYETRVVEEEENFRCEISYRREPSRNPPKRRVGYRHISGVFQLVQAAMLVAAAL